MNNPFEEDVEAQLRLGNVKPSIDAAHGNHGERVPPQQMIVTPPKLSKSVQEKSTLLDNPGRQKFESQSPSSPRQYVVYGDEEEEVEYDSHGGQGPKVHRLVNFWASVLAEFLSIPLVGLSFYILVASPLTSALTITCTIGSILGCLSIIIELAHLCPKYFTKAFHWGLGRHSMLHSVIACFFILPLIQHQQILGLLFLFHLVPAFLFYTARIRHEWIPAKI